MSNYRVSIKVGSFIEDLKAESLERAETTFDFYVKVVTDPGGVNPFLNVEAIDSIRLSGRRNSCSRWKVIKEWNRN